MRSNHYHYFFYHTLINFLRVISKQIVDINFSNNSSSMLCLLEEKSGGWRAVMHQNYRQWKIGSNFLTTFIVL